MSDAEATKPAEEAQPQVTEQTETETKPEQTEQTETEAKTEEAPKDAKEDKEDKASILKTKGQIDYENHKNNNKFDPSKREVSDDPNAIRKQVEFYFGDWNYPQDKFMWEQCGGEENKPIAIEKIHSFKRMRTFQPYNAVVAALRDSKILDVEGEEGAETIKRKVPYKPMPAGKAKQEASTVYVKGFGDEQPNTQFDLEKFFAQFGDIKAVKLRRTNESFFKGSVFVTFSDEEEAKKFVAMDPAPKWEEHDLKIMTKKAYCEEKNDLIRQGKLEPNQNTNKKFYEGREGSTQNRGRRDPDDWKRRRDNDQKNGFRGGRGGRGRGRGFGGRGRGGGGRDRRDGDRNGDRNGQKKENAPERTQTNDVKPSIQSSNDANGKRAREDDGAGGEPPSKKVDAKEAVSTSS